MSGSPTQRTLAHLRKTGACLVSVVERWNPHAGIRQDLFGCIDVLAILNGRTVAVQATSRSNISARVKKIKANPALPVMASAGWQVVVHGWSKSKAGRWELKEVQLTEKHDGTPSTS